MILQYRMLFSSTSFFGKKLVIDVAVGLDFRCQVVEFLLENGSSQGIRDKLGNTAGVHRQGLAA